MILQHLVFPTHICENKELYFRMNDKVELKNGEIYMASSGVVSTDTYFNLFDAFTWEKYTGISGFSFSIACIGKGSAALYYFNIDRKNEKKIDVKFFENLESDIITFALKNPSPGYYYLKIKAENKSVISSIAIQTESEIREDVYLGVNICTYKRSQQVYDNIKRFLESDFFQNGNALYGKIKICVVDNASELENINHPFISIIHNRNTGGAGGFTRGINEFKNKDQDITHMIFMDDDVQFIPETFDRLYSLLSYLLPEYKDAVIAGRMFRMDRKYVQYTAAEKWNCGDIKHIGFQQDMTLKENLMNVNNPEDAEYTGWWMGCFPMDFVKKNIPIPFFIHCDDVEYGLRHGGSPIILNGIQVWHETYEYRQLPLIEYYDTRNTLFVNEIYKKVENEREVYLEWKRKIGNAHKNNDWLREYMIIKGMSDYIKGFKWLNLIDPEKKHLQLSKRKKSCRWINCYMWRWVTVKYFFKKNFLRRKK